MALIWAIIITAIAWNFFTWYYGIPCSSSHTLIGAIFGAGLSYTLLHPDSSVVLNWQKIIDIGLALLITPVLGFVLALTLMYILFKVVKKKKIFKEPKEKKAPPFWIRSLMIITSTSISFSHGSNDGQKGVGLMMMILVALAPAYFALDNSKDPKDLVGNIQRVEYVLNRIDTTRLSYAEKQTVSVSVAKFNALVANLSKVDKFSELPHTMVADARVDLTAAAKKLKSLEEDNKAAFVNVSKHDLRRFKNDLKRIDGYAEYVPVWVILLISLSLGLGTMIGWKRIVVTISEKIGKTQMTYAQGATSGVIAASTIGLSSAIGLPVSTTHILSSGIAGSMVASGGIKNLQTKTLKNIGIAWVVTLPVSILVSGLLYWLFFSIAK